MKRFLVCLILAGCGSAGKSARVTSGERETGGGSRLKAGERDDNSRFADYTRYFKAYPDRNVRKIDITDRMILNFVDRDGGPVSLTPVRILADSNEVYRATTTAGGQLMFPPRAIGVDPRHRTFEAEILGRSVLFHRGNDVEIEVGVRREERNEVALDIAFCLDTTGGMAEEIRQIKRTMRAVVERLDSLRPRPRLRFAMVLYRDRRDEYVTRLIDFTSDPDQFLNDLRRVEAGKRRLREGSVNEAFYHTVCELTWSPDEAIRLIFLIGGAPPYMDDPNDYDCSLLMRRALRRGIKIFTVAAEGLGNQGEFVWRQLAQFTLGKFFFLDYGGTTPQHVGSYDVKNLDDLMVTAVSDEVKSLLPHRRIRRQPSQGRGRDSDDFDTFREYRDDDR